MQNWPKVGYGVNLDGQICARVAWADSVWLPSRNPDRVAQVFRALTAEARALGLAWKADPLQITRSSCGPAPDLEACTGEGAVKVARV